MKNTSLVAATLGLMVGFAGSMLAQTPPVEPSDFSTTFTALASEGTLVQLFDQNQQVSWLPGLVKGALYEDFTNHRVRMDFFQIDGTAEQTVYQFYDKQVQYTYDFKTSSCSKSAFTLTIVPFFNFLADSKLASGVRQIVLFKLYGAINVDTWQYKPPMGMRVREIDLSVTENASQTPVSMLWFAPMPVQLTFDTFVAGQPDASAFNLPYASHQHHWPGGLPPAHSGDVSR